MLISTTVLHGNIFCCSFFVVSTQSLNWLWRNSPEQPFLSLVKPAFWEPASESANSWLRSTFTLWAKITSLLEGIQVLTHQLIEQNWDPGWYLESLGDLPFPETVILDPTPRGHMVEHMDGPKTRYVLLDCCMLSARMYSTVCLSDNLSPDSQLHEDAWLEFVTLIPPTAVFSSWW